MSTINGLSGPRLPTSSPSAAREAPRTSFISRVQVAASNAVPQQVSGGAVSGRDIISSAINSARQSQPAASTAGTDPQMKAIQEMSRSFLQSTVQSIFQGFGEGPKIEQE